MCGAVYSSWRGVYIEVWRVFPNIRLALAHKLIVVAAGERKKKWIPLLLYRFERAADYFIARSDVRYKCDHSRAAKSSTNYWNYYYMCIITATCASMLSICVADEIYGRTLAASPSRIHSKFGRKWNRHHSKMVKCLCTEVAIAMTRLPITSHSFHFAAKPIHQFLLEVFVVAVSMPVSA